MSDLNMQPQSSDSVFIRFWQRIPILIRAVVSGFLVYFVVGFVAWLAIVALIPAPWSLVIMALVLWIYLKYFSGRWWPKTTAATRSEYFRATKLSTGVWKWSLITALLVVAAIQSSLVITFRVIEFPADAWALGFDYKAFPIWLIWLYIVLMASVAGITEEVGFRGYMQVPLEKRYGPAAGIAIVSIMFMVLHLNQAWAPFVLIHLFVIGVLWGIMAYTSGSLIPGIISHTIADIFNFSYWWTDVAGKFDKMPIAETGIDSHFVIWLLIFVASIALFVWAARKTLLARKSEAALA
ncbi:MAG: CPBP family intramembrane metalloprotease [Anaerolineales bacterium]|nr:CPBP family intramembrane metalloprotease [Anaerolineales bacterium]